MTAHAEVRRRTPSAPPRVAGVVAALTGLTALTPQIVRASDVAGAVSVVSFTSRGGQNTRAASTVAALGLPSGGFVSAGATRYDDSNAGAGWSVSAGLGARLASPVSVRAWGTRFLGERGDRAWRFKAGPALASASGAGLGVYFVHQRDEQGTRASGFAADASLPVAPRLRATASTMVASADLGGGTWQSAAGLGWAVIRNVELSAALGVGAGAALAPGESGGGGPGGGGGPPPLPIPILRSGAAASDAASGSSREVRPSLEIAARILFP